MSKLHTSHRIVAIIKAIHLGLICP
jgi:hypothetical protein